MKCYTCRRSAGGSIKGKGKGIGNRLGESTFAGGQCLRGSTFAWYEG